MVDLDYNVVTKILNYVYDLWYNRLVRNNYAFVMLEFEKYITRYECRYYTWDGEVLVSHTSAVIWDYIDLEMIRYDPEIVFSDWYDLP